MADRRLPGFTVDLGFYDSPEVQSIPRKIRAAAIGVWALAGSFSANKLQDGYVQPEILKQLGCTAAIRAALMATVDAHGEPSPLWIDAHGGGIQFTRWAKWQRTKAEITAYREADAKRKRAAREGSTTAGRTAHVTSTTERSRSTRNKNMPHTSGDESASTSGDSEMSGRTPVRVREESRDPKTETETKNRTTHLKPVEDLGSGDGGIAATPGADLVREIIPKGHPAATRTALRLQASEMINNGTERELVAAGLRLWVDKPNVGIGRTILASMVSEVIKSQNPTGGSNGRPKSKVRAYAELAAEVRAQEQAAIEPANRKAIT